MDFETLGIVGVAAITVICYLVGLIVKATPAPNQIIPIVCGVAGLALGLVCYFTGLDVLPATDPVTAAAVGVVSGRAATGINQVAKQLTKGGAGFGSDYPGQQDSGIAKNLAMLDAAGIPYGVYHYSYARDKQGGIDEAKHCLRLLGAYKPQYGVWFDMEDASTLGGDLPGAAKGFCDTIQAAGHTVGVYANAGWWKNRLTDPIFDKWPKWVAQYASECQIADPDIWQYTDRLVIGGQTFDGNWCYTTFSGGGKVSKSRVLQTQENRITRGFGNGHTGVDLGWQTTQTDGILAHSDGKVVFCQTGYGNNTGSTGNASYGNCVKLDHGNGYYTLYAHLSDVTVKLGQKVNKGQVIGHMGNTGNSYGTHLHFEVRRGASTCIDPAPYIAADLPGLPTYTETPVDYQVEVTADDLNIRSGPGTGYASQGVCKPGKHQIVAEADGTGASKWGKLSTGGWIALDYATKIKEEDDMTEKQVQEIADARINAFFKNLEGLSASKGWGEEAVQWAKEHKVMAGDPDGRMRPKDLVTREEAAQMFRNYHDNNG